MGVIHMYLRCQAMRKCSYHAYMATTQNISLAAGEHVKHGKLLLFSGCYLEQNKIAQTNGNKTEQNERRTSAFLHQNSTKQIVVKGGQR